MKYCNGKIIYHSEDEAKRVRNHRERRGARKLRIYSCDKCYGWHLTSKLP